MLGITVDKNFDKNIIDKNRENDSNNSNRKRSLIIDKMKEKENSDVTATMGTLIFPDKEPENLQSKSVPPVSSGRSLVIITGKNDECNAQLRMIN